MTVSTYLYNIANKCGVKADEAMHTAITSTGTTAMTAERDMRGWAHLSTLFANQAAEFRTNEEEE